MTSRGIKAGAAAFLALSLAVLTACGSGGTEAAEVVDGPWEDVVAAAKKEGRVNLYSVAPPIQNDRIVAAFNKLYPDIKVSVTRGAGELPARVESEIKSGSEGADVFIYSDPSLFTKLSDHLLEVNGPSVEGWSDDFWAVEGKAIIPTKYPWTMFVWNTKIFPNGIKTWDDLLDPAVKGKLALRNDLTTSIAGVLDFQERRLGPDYLKALAKQEPKFYTSAVPMNQAVASGEVGVTNLSTPSIVKDLQQQGAPIDFAMPDPGFAIMWGAAALDNSRRPNAARVFLDFLMSPAGQEAINGDGFGAAGREGIPGSLDLTGWEFLDSAKFTPEVMNEMKAKFAEYFGS